MQCKIYWKLDVQNGPVREWSLSTENQQYNVPRHLRNQVPICFLTSRWAFFGIFVGHFSARIITNHHKSRNTSQLIILRYMELGEMYTCICRKEL